LEVYRNTGGGKIDIPNGAHCIFAMTRQTRLKEEGTAAVVYPPRIVGWERWRAWKAATAESFLLLTRKKNASDVSDAPENYLRKQAWS